MEQVKASSFTRSLQTIVTNKINRRRQLRRVCVTSPGRHKRNTEILSMLLEKADVQGYLTTEDLMEFYPQVSDDAERLEQIVLALRRRGVDILDQEDPDIPFDDSDDVLI